MIHCILALFRFLSSEFRCLRHTQSQASLYRSRVTLHFRCSKSDTAPYCSTRKVWSVHALTILQCDRVSRVIVLCAVLCKFSFSDATPLLRPADEYSIRLLGVAACSAGRRNKTWTPDALDNTDSVLELPSPMSLTIQTQLLHERRALDVLRRSQDWPRSRFAQIYPIFLLEGNANPCTSVMLMILIQKSNVQVQCPAFHILETCNFLGCV